MIRPHSARDDNRDFLMRYLLSMFGPNCITYTYEVYTHKKSRSITQVESS